MKNSYRHKWHFYKIFFCLLCFLAFPFWLVADQHSNNLYAKIPDIYHPTSRDYQKIQNYLRHGQRPLIGDLHSWQYREKALKFRLLPRIREEKIEHGIIPVNCSLDNKTNCIVLYCSFNYNYPKALKNLIQVICNSDFVGHVLYRIGGWPDLAGGGLRFVHVPFAFKVCAFNEAKNLGYQNVLWLDASVTPLRSLNEVFETIQNHGYFTFRAQHNIEALCNQRVCNAMGIDYPKQASSISSCVSGIIGFNFNSSKAKQAFDRWFEITRDHEDYYFSHYLETSIISIILYQMGMTDHPYWEGRVTWNKDEIHKPGLQFFVDKWLVQPNWPN